MVLCISNIISFFYKQITESSMLYTNNHEEQNFNEAKEFTLKDKLCLYQKNELRNT